MIFPIFLVIRFHGEVGLFYTAVVFSTACVAYPAVDILYTQMNRVRVVSKIFAEMLIGKVMSPFQIRFLRSCRPLYCKVGGAFGGTEETVPNILQGIVLDNLINLLLTF